MKCVSCAVDIPVSFVVAIEQNKCPGCSGPIQTEESIEFMEELAKAFERMPNDPKGIAGWILSNYHLNKINDEEPPEHFYRPITEEEKLAGKNLKQAPEIVNKFISRTDFPDSTSPTRQQELAKLARDIKGVDTSMYGGEEEEQEPDLEVEDDFVNVGGVIKPTEGGLPHHAPLLDPQANISAEEIAAAQALIGGGGGTDTDDMYPAPEDAKSAKTIQQQRLKRVKTQQAFDDGGGSFRR